MPGPAAQRASRRQDRRVPLKLHLPANVTSGTQGKTSWQDRLRQKDSSRASREQDPEGQVSERGGRARGPVSPSNQGGRHLCPAATALSRPGPAGRALPPSAGWGTWPWAPCSGPGLVHLPVHDRQDRTPLGAASRRALNTHLGQYRHPVPRCRHAYFLCPHFLPQPRV